jgi:hypothetical protein
VGIRGVPHNGPGSAARLCAAGPIRLAGVSRGA